MVNCSKCGTDVNRPVKTWKIKQTPMALFECPSCKTKWRSKFVEAPTIPQIAHQIVEEQPKNIQVQTVIGEQKREPQLFDAPKAVVKNNTEKSSKPISIFSGIRLFFSSIFSGR